MLQDRPDRAAFAASAGPGAGGAGLAESMELQSQRTDSAPILYFMRAERTICVTA